MKTVPFNEVYLRVGGTTATAPSYETTLGAPIGIFTRSPTYESLLTLLRFRYAYEKELPLVYVNPERGVRAVSGGEVERELLR